MAKHVNIAEITKSNKGKSYTYYRARLVFPFDEALGYAPKAKDFYGKTKMEAAAKRQAYLDAPKRKTKGEVNNDPFLAYLAQTFLVQAEADALARVKERGTGWSTFKNRRARVQRYLLDPHKDLKATRQATLRFVAISHLTPALVAEYFKALVRDGVSADNRYQLKIDLQAALRPVRRSLPDPVFTEYFEEVEVAQPQRPRRALFDYETLRAIIEDPSKPLQYRAMVYAAVALQRRPSELWALQVGDLHHSEQWGDYLAFFKAMRVVGPGELRVTQGSKDGMRGTRAVGCPAALAAMLRELCAGRGGNEPLFSHPTTGLALNKNSFTKLWHRTIKPALGLPSDAPDFYSLKHLGNSIALAAGVTPEAQADKMGHADTRMALSAYRSIFTRERMAASSPFELPGEKRGVTPGQEGENEGQTGGDKSRDERKSLGR